MIDKMSNVLIRESSDLDQHTSDDMELDQENMDDVQQTASRMVQSANEIDQRIVQLYAMKDGLITETVNKPDISELPELALTQQLENT